MIRIYRASVIAIGLWVIATLTCAGGCAWLHYHPREA
ncbi:hypothetical protein J2S59_000176 [Nocardioides massiliensis]|uniref:Lipoprotein n=1 Tax=Nocardioides massiliensis TaxID=1325935 RepID=A0ABT9NJH3_9ACTN|nr:hypothetical protein [Nocardioides massiliensis]